MSYDTPVDGSSLLAASFAALLLLVYQATTWSMVSIWLRSDTFAHGFLILPISLWLIWRQREQLLSLPACPAPPVLALMLPLGALWFVSRQVDVLVVQQLAVIALLLVGVWAIVGHERMRLLAFPLAYLFLAVPMGEGLIGPMMELTAWSTVWLIDATGIPVYREGMFISLPSGNWSVVEACSGVRYIIASVTLGVLYSYLSYRSIWRRLCFIVLSAVIPVVANCLRAYLIVILGHVSDMKIATGVDHLIYGWVFFGLVIVLMFWLGSLFEDSQLNGEPPVRHRELVSHTGTSTNRVAMATALAALVIAALWPWLAQALDRRAAPLTGVPLPALQAEGGWQPIPAPGWHWQPLNRAGGQVAAFFQDGPRRVAVYVQYAEQGKGDVIAGGYEYVRSGEGWRVLDRRIHRVGSGSEIGKVISAQVQSQDELFYTWSWYQIGWHSTTSDYIAKFRESLARVSGRNVFPYRVIIVTPERGEPEHATEVLQRFLMAHESTLLKSLATTRGGAT